MRRAHFVDPRRARAMDAAGAHARESVPGGARPDDGRPAAARLRPAAPRDRRAPLAAARCAPGAGRDHRRAPRRGRLRQDDPGARPLPRRRHRGRVPRRRALGDARRAAGQPRRQARGPDRGAHRRARRACRRSRRARPGCASCWPTAACCWWSTTSGTGPTWSRSWSPDRAARTSSRRATPTRCPTTCARSGSTRCRRARRTRCSAGACRRGKRRRSRGSRAGSASGRLLLKLVNGVLRDRVARAGDTPRAARWRTPTRCSIAGASRASIRGTPSSGTRPSPRRSA